MLSNLGFKADLLFNNAMEVEMKRRWGKTISVAQLVDVSDTPSN